MIKFSHAVIIIFIILLNISFSYADIPGIVLNQKKSVVTIYVNDKDGKQIGTGTGFIVGSDGIIATNYHVMSMYLDGDNKLLIKMENGAFFPLNNVVNYDEENDVAIFKVDGKELPRVKIAKNYKPKQGESIVIIGSPLGLETTVSDGIISSIRGKDSIIQITAAISPGSSGSPVFNSKGEVIGVATFLIKGGQSLNFAIPVKHVANLLKGTKKVKEKGIVNSEPLPAVKPPPASSETGRDGHFIAYDNGTVLDTKTNLMWARMDNGYDINWLSAKRYCENYRGGGYTDWRMPTQNELAELYDTGKGYTPACATGGDAGKVHLTNLIYLSCWPVWASEIIGRPSGQNFVFSYGIYHSITPSADFNLRALPVRSVK